MTDSNSRSLFSDWTLLVGDCTVMEVNDTVVQQHSLEFLTSRFVEASALHLC